MLSSCDRAGDVRRAEEWTRVVDELVLDRIGGPRILHTHCQVAYGSVLLGAGRWSEAEAAIQGALGPEGSRSSGHRIDANARLAELRLDQGRTDEAAQLVALHPDDVATALPAGATPPAARRARPGGGDDRPRPARAGRRHAAQHAAAGPGGRGRAGRRRRRGRGTGRAASCRSSPTTRRARWCAPKPSSHAGACRPRTASSPTPRSPWRRRRGRSPTRNDRSAPPRCGSSSPRCSPPSGDTPSAVLEARAAYTERVADRRRPVRRPRRGTDAVARRHSGTRRRRPRRRRCAHPPRGRGARPAPRGAHATPRSGPGCSSRPRPPSTTSAGCWRSSGSAAGPRPRPWPRRCWPARRTSTPRGNRGRNRGHPRFGRRRSLSRCEWRCRPGARGGGTNMETRIDEIAPDVFRLSTYVPEVAAPLGFTFNQFVVRGRGAVPVPHRDAGAVPERVRRGRPCRRPRPPPLDLLRPRRGGRVRSDEPVPRRRAPGPGRPQRPRLHGVAERPRRPSAARGRRRRGDRPRRAATALPDDAPRAAQLGERHRGTTRPTARCSPATCSRRSVRRNRW